MRWAMQPMTANQQGGMGLFQVFDVPQMRQDTVFGVLTDRTGVDDDDVCFAGFVGMHVTLLDRALNSSQNPACSSGSQSSLNGISLSS
jgi:hypothetical protein